MTQSFVHEVYIKLTYFIVFIVALSAITLQHALLPCNTDS